MGMQAGSDHLNSEINVTPMVDIMLVLLIIFMLVTPNLQQGISVDLPKNMNAPEVDPAIIKETSAVISIPNDGEFYLGKNKYSIRDINDDRDPEKTKLGADIKKVLEKKSPEEQIVYVKSGTGVSYGQVVGIIDVIRQQDITQIGLVADRKKKGGSSAPAPPAQ
ncbi:MAG TPA: biopolymer transporter ExbD [Pyrinomonadaceae bacterium]|jgi:biopolymer transport protein ExbD/biopolymer transport protein TolR